MQFSFQPLGFPSVEEELGPVGRDAGADSAAPAVPLTFYCHLAERRGKGSFPRLAVTKRRRRCAAWPKEEGAH